MAGFCTVNELVARTGSTLDAGVLQAMIDDANTEVNSYLSPYGLGASNTAQSKSAEMKLAMANLIMRMRMDGTKGTSRTIGDYTLSDDPEKQIQTLRAQAFEILDQYVQSQTVLSNSKRTYVVRVN